MEKEAINTIIFAVSFATLAVIIYHFVTNKVREIQFSRALNELAEQLTDSVQKGDAIFLDSSTGITIEDNSRKRRWTEEEDQLVMSQRSSDRILAEKINRSANSIAVRRYNLRNR